MTLGIVFGIVAGALWGFSFIIPFVLGLVPAEMLAFGRFGFYGLVAFVLLIPQFKKLPQLLNRKRLLWLIALSLLGNSFYYIVMVEAVRRTGVPITSVIMGALPVTIAVFGARSIFELKKFLPALTIMTAGLVLIQWPLVLAIYNQDTSVSFLGAFLAMAAHISWLLFALGNAHFLKNNSDISPKVWSELLGVGSFATLAVYLVFKLQTQGAEYYIPHFTAQFIVLSFVLGILGSVIGNWLWNIASHKLPTTLVGQLIVSETIFAILYESLYKGTSPHGYEYVAMVLLIVSVVLASQKAHNATL